MRNVFIGNITLGQDDEGLLKIYLKDTRESKCIRGMDVGILEEILTDFYNELEEKN